MFETFAQRYYSSNLYSGEIKIFDIRNTVFTCIHQSVPAPPPPPPVYSTFVHIFGTLRYSHLSVRNSIVSVCPINRWIADPSVLFIKCMYEIDDLSYTTRRNSTSWTTDSQRCGCNDLYGLRLNLSVHDLFTYSKILLLMEHTSLTIDQLPYITLFNHNHLISFVFLKVDQ